jgi:hypothetical protein
MKELFKGLKEEGYNSKNPHYFDTDTSTGDLANRIANIKKWANRCGVNL